MTNNEIREFIDCITYQDCKVKLNGEIYWCMGISWSKESNKYNVSVYEENPHTHEFIRELFSYSSSSKDECIRRFLNENYWDGKSFYEIANELEWIDL